MDAETRIENLERSILFLEAKLQLYMERVDSMEKTLSNGKRISMLPVAVSGLHPLVDQPSPNEVLIAVTVEKEEQKAPVIKIPLKLFDSMMTRKDGDVVTIDDYVQIQNMAQRQPCLGGGWEWRLLA